MPDIFKVRKTKQERVAQNIRELFKIKPQLTLHEIRTGYFRKFGVVLERASDWQPGLNLLLNRREVERVKHGLYRALNYDVEQTICPLCGRMDYN